MPVLIVEDDDMQRDMLALLLQRKLGYRSLTARHGREALNILQSDDGAAIRLIVLDLQMPVMDGLETLEHLQRDFKHIPVVMLTGSRDVNDAVKAMQAGAVDFVTKPYEGERIMVTVKNALRLNTLSREVSRLKSESEGRFTFENLIGAQSGLTAQVALGEKAAASDIAVLIDGETGTGKEVFAKAIHGQSARAGHPFIAVNCGAIPAQLVESTLFGHEKGAFTGATDKVIGKFREAEGGTIFLDEVGELPLDTQVKLLRVLQQKEVEPVGAGKPVPVNVRVISATNRNLEEEVTKGNFREDLFFRLNVLEITLPPLRERKEDIKALARHFMERFCAAQACNPKEIAPEVERYLNAQDWPGNIRQLENTISRAMVVSDSAQLEMEDFTAVLTSDITPLSAVPASQDAISLTTSDGSFKTMEEIEREAMELALTHHNQNTTQAAKALGIAKSTFYRKIKA